MSSDRRTDGRTRFAGIFANKYIEGMPHVVELLNVSSSGLQVRRILEPESATQTYPLEIALGGLTFWAWTRRVWRRGNREALRIVSADALDHARLRKISPRGEPGVIMITRRHAIACGLSIALLGACSKATPPPPDEATLREEDKQALERIVAIDVRASQAMRDADTATGRGDAGAAADIVGTRAKPAVEEALQAAGSATFKTAWGKAKRDELLGILRDRNAEMPKYEEAVKGGDPEKMLAAIEAQAAIERRALATVAAVKEGR